MRLRHNIGDKTWSLHTWTCTLCCSDGWALQRNRSNRNCDVTDLDERRCPRWPFDPLSVNRDEHDTCQWPSLGWPVKQLDRARFCQAAPRHCGVKTRLEETSVSVVQSSHCVRWRQKLTRHSLFCVVCSLSGNSIGDDAMTELFSGLLDLHEMRKSDELQVRAQVNSNSDYFHNFSSFYRLVRQTWTTQHLRLLFRVPVQARNLASLWNPLISVS